MSKLAIGPIPLYHQMQTDLAARIATGEFGAGDALPSEEQLGRHYGVSRITVRKALEALEGQGLIVRRRGVGSFVAEAETGVHAVRLNGSLDAFLTHAHELKAQVVSLGLADAPEDVLAEFGLARGTRMLRLEAVNFTADVPIAHSEFFFPAELAALMTIQDIDGSEPIVRIVERKMGVRLGRARQVVEADALGAVGAGYLGLAEGTPVLRSRRTYYTTTGEPVEVATLHYHPQRYRYEVELKGGLHGV